MDENDDDELILLNNPSQTNRDFDTEPVIPDVNDDSEQNDAVDRAPVTNNVQETLSETTNTLPDTVTTNKEKKPFPYCRFVTKYPIISFLLTLSIHLTLAAVTGILIITGYDLFPTNFEGVPMELYTIPYKMRQNAWNQRNNYNYRTDIYVNDPSQSYWPRQLGEHYYNIELYYDTNGGNIFTKSHLRKISEIENDIISIRDYKYFCSTVNVSMICRKPQSVVRFFDGSYADVNPIFYDPEFENIHSVLYEAYTNNKTKDDFMYFLPETFTLSKTYSYAPLTRSKILVSWSDEGNMTAEDFLKGPMKSKLLSVSASVSEFDMLYLSEFVLFDDLKKQALYDAYFSAGSLGFIFIFIIVHTRSLWITFWAVFSICTSYLGTNLIYRCLLKYHYFGYFHLMAIFIILGIGADDLFVFYDTWRLTSHKTYKGLAHRLHDAYSKSMLSMLITSVTTAAAFFSSCSSPVLATRSFGIFSGILVIINYISVIVFFPTVVIVYHVKLRQCTCCKNRCCKKNGTETGQEQDVQSIGNSINGLYCQSGDSMIQTQTPEEANNQISEIYSELQNSIEESENNSEDSTTLQDPITKKSKRLVRFVRDHYFRFITDKVLRWIILLFFFLLVVFFSYQASRLEVDNREKFCDKFYSLSEKEISDLKIRRNPRTNELEVACFTRHMEEFLKSKESELVHKLNLSLPWDLERTKAFLDEISEVEIPRNILLNLTGYLDIPIRYWLTNGHTMTYNADYRMFSDLIGEQRTNFSSTFYDAYTDMEVSYGHRIKYIGVLINTTIDQLTTSFTDGIPIVERWETFIQDEMDKMPQGLRGGFQFGHFEWHWLYVQQSLARNAIIGISLGVSLAFPIITIATMNIILGFLATLSICCTTVCVIGIIPLVGWKLGLLVSLNMCLVVGLSVDYVVHLAEGYYLSPHKDRISRTRDMLEAMGSPVIYGAITTIGAAVFMFFAKIQFFLQFATFIFCNIGFSFLFSLGFFTTMVGIFGPENDTGSLKKLCHCFRNCRFWTKRTKPYTRVDRSGVI